MRKVNIGGSEYTIKVVKKVEFDDLDKKSDYYGACNALLKEIQIKKQLEKRNFNDTMKHEIYHACLFEAGFDDYSEDEHLINMLAMQHENLHKLFTKLGVNNDK